jgi:hypothetical protein
MAAIQIPINNLMKIRPPESILPREMFIIDMDKGLKIILYTAVIIRILRAGNDISSSLGRTDKAILPSWKT